MATDNKNIDFTAAKLVVDRTWALLRTLQDAQSNVMHALFLLEVLGGDETVKTHLNEALLSIDDLLVYAHTEYHEACTKPKSCH